MKTIWLSLIALISSAPLLGQDSTKTGHILYTSITDISDSEYRQMVPDLPTEITTTWDLYFTDSCSYYTFRPEEQEDDFSTGGVSFRVMRFEPKDIYYLNFNENSYTHYTEFMTKPFLIEDELTMDGWKMTGKQGVVQGYPCLEAMKTDEDSVVTLVWFTPRIQVKAGPGSYVGFPGAVLYVNIEDGKQTISASVINMGKTSDEYPEIPDDAEEVTQAEYERIVKEKKEQMRRTRRR